MKSSIASNLDFTLTSKQRAQREADEYNSARIQDAIDRAAKDGATPREVGQSGQVLATYDQLKDQAAYAMGDRDFIRPIGYRTGPQFLGGFQWILTDADAEMVRQGLACQQCLDKYPSAWTPACPTCLLPR